MFYVLYGVSIYPISFSLCFIRKENTHSMNNPRRKALNKIKDQIEDLRMALIENIDTAMEESISALEDAVSNLEESEELLEEEQEAFDNMPEGLQCSDIKHNRKDVKE